MTRPFQRLALAIVVGACLMAAGAYATAFRPEGAPLAAAGVLALATALLMAGLVLLGAGVRGGRGALVVAVMTLVGVVGGGLVAALRIGAPDGPGAPLAGGLPAAAAVLVYGVGLIPAVVVPLVYAWTFDRTTLRPEILDEVRRRGREYDRRADPDGTDS